MSADDISRAAATRRLDQWLWFARLVKSRSLASHLCATGAVTVNGLTVNKAHYTVRIGDAIGVTQGAFRRTVRVVALGARRGPATEARSMHEEIASPARLSKIAPAWAPLLADNDPLGDPVVTCRPKL